MCGSRRNVFQACECCLLWVNTSSAESTGFHGYPCRGSSGGVRKPGTAALVLSAPVNIAAGATVLSPGFAAFGQNGSIYEKTFCVRLVKNGCKRKDPLTFLHLSADLTPSERTWTRRRKHPSTDLTPTVVEMWWDEWVRSKQKVTIQGILLIH